MYSQVFLQVLQHSVIMLQFANLILEDSQNLSKPLIPAQRRDC